MADRGGSEVEEERAHLLEKRSEMLDEVNQLMELVNAEKTTLQERIITLEGELGECRRRGVEEVKQETAGLRKALERTMQELAEARRETDSLTAKVELPEVQSKAFATTTLLEEESDRAQGMTPAAVKLERRQRDKQSQAGDEQSQTQSSPAAAMREKVKSMKKEQRETGRALKSQCAENVKLKAMVAKLQDHSNTLQSQNVQLKARVDMLQRKCKRAQDEGLAAKGRLAMARKSEETLQLKYSALEKMCASTRESAREEWRREERRLQAECRRKNELLATYSAEIANAQTERSRLLEENRTLQESLCTEQEARRRAELMVQKKEQAIRRLQRQLEESGRRLQVKNDGFALREELELRLQSLGQELNSAVEELASLRKKLWERERNASEELEQEREKAKSIVGVSQKAIEKLSAELEATRQHHTNMVGRMGQEWRRRVEEARMDCERVKEAGTRRCAELAKELWDLKTRERDSQPA